MDKILKLKNVKDDYKLIEYGTQSFYEDNEDSGESWHDIRTVRYGLYNSKGNYILLEKVRYEDEEPDTMQIVIDAMQHGEYERMSEELNDSDNHIIWLKQVYGTTTDVVFMERECGDIVNASTIRMAYIDNTKKIQGIKKSVNLSEDNISRLHKIYGVQTDAGMNGIIHDLLIDAEKFEKQIIEKAKNGKLQKQIAKMNK